MTLDTNPHLAQMADESMVRTLAAQTEAIWPQELPLLRRYLLPDAPRVLDAGCGTGEGTARLAEAFPRADVLGVDILDGHLERARVRAASLGGRARFEHRSVYALDLPDASFDLTMCRHVLHAIPCAGDVIAELARVTRPGGVLHLLCEDYGMIHFPTRRFDPDDMWPRAAVRFGESTGTDLRVGRHAPGLLRAAGLEGVRVDYVVVDTLRVARPVFAAIWRAWRDGYADIVAAALEVPRAEAMARWDDQIEAILDPTAYAAWFAPIVSGVVPGGGGARGA